MRFVGNIVYLLTGGIFLSLGWLCAALMFWLLVVTQPLARSCLQLAKLCMWPAGRDVIRASQVATYRNYIRTGQPSAGGKLTPAAYLMRSFELVLWLPVGAVLILGHFLHAGVMALPIVTNRWTRQDIGLAGVAFFPFEAGVASEGQARITRHVGSPRCAVGRRTCWTRMAPPLTAASAAGLIMWAPSDNQPHAPPVAVRPVPQASRDWSGRPDEMSLVFTNFDPASGRPEAGPPLFTESNVAGSVPPLTADDCVRSEVRVPVHLSRRTLTFGTEPLASRRSGAHVGFSDPDTARYVGNIERWVGDAAIWRAKMPGDSLCRSAVLRRIEQASPMPVTRKALIAKAVIERTGDGSFEGKARRTGPLNLPDGLLVSSAKRAPMATALAETPGSPLTLH